MRYVEHDVDVCVVGGGMAGVCAAIASARTGAKTLLMQDRPVLGGNASSEIRMQVDGARGKNVREAGILEEIELENYYRNTSLAYPVWDSILYEKVKFEENMTLLLNCTCQSAELGEDGRILSVRGWTLNAETYHTVRAKFFIDCSGDSILAPLSGAKYAMGREGRDEFGESIAPEVADTHTMGMSCLLMARETTEPQPFIKPEWAYTYETDADLPMADHHINTNFWWVELGGMGDTIHDTDTVRDELLKIAFGVWDHMKNKGDHGCENWILEWVGFLPGKRESRRYRGAHIITQQDVEAGGPFPDVVAVAGWTMDDHFPEGFYYRGGHPTIYHPAPSPWGIPYRALYSVNVPNLYFAGRNISVTHTALSSSRVAATCGVLGQAAGTAAALAVKCGCTDPREVDVELLQDTLQWDDSWLPSVPRKLSAPTLSAKTDFPALRDGNDRENVTAVALGESVSYAWDAPVSLTTVRVIFDSFFDRPYNNQPAFFPLVQDKYKMPATLTKSYRIEAQKPDGEWVTVADVACNRRRCVKHEIGFDCTALRVIPTATWGAETAGIFSLDVR